MRYEDIGLNEVVEINREFQYEELGTSFEEAPPTFQLSAVVAEFAEVLRGSYWAREGSLQAVADQARRVQRLLADSTEVADFASLAIERLAWLPKPTAADIPTASVGIGETLSQDGRGSPL